MLNDRTFKDYLKKKLKAPQGIVKMVFQQNDSGAAYPGQSAIVFTISKELNYWELGNLLVVTATHSHDLFSKEVRSCSHPLNAGHVLWLILIE